MQENNNADLRIKSNFEEKIQDEIGTLNTLFYPLKAALPAKIKVKKFDQATQNLKNFSSQIINDQNHLRGELSKYNSQNTNQMILNIPLISTQTSRNSLSKTQNTFQNKSTQAIFKPPNLQTNILSESQERSSINQQNSMNLNNINCDSNSQTLQQFDLITRNLQQDMNQMQYNPANQLIQQTNLSNDISNTHSQPSNQHQTSLYIPLIQQSNLSIKQNDKANKLNKFMSNDDFRSQKQPFINEKSKESQFSIQSKEGEIQIQSKQHSKNEQTVKQQIVDKIDFQSNFNQEIESNSNFNNIKQINQNGLKTIDAINNKINITSQKSKNKIFSESNEDQKQLSDLFTRIQNKTGDNQCLMCSSTNNKLNITCSHSEQLFKQQELNNNKLSQQQFNQQVQNQNQFNVNEQEYIQNELNQNQNQVNLNQCQQIQTNIGSFDAKNELNLMLTHKGSVNFNTSLGRQFAKTNYQTNYSKSQANSPKSDQFHFTSPKSKPFYHPFCHQSTKSSGDDQGIVSQFFISNLSKYHPSFSTRKSSSSSFINTVKSNKGLSTSTHQQIAAQGFHYFTQGDDDYGQTQINLQSNNKQRENIPYSQNFNFDHSKLMKLQLEQQQLQQRDNYEKSFSRSKNQKSDDNIQQNRISQLNENQQCQTNIQHNNPNPYSQKQYAQNQKKHSQNAFSPSNQKNISQQNENGQNISQKIHIKQQSQIPNNYSDKMNIYNLNQNPLDSQNFKQKSCSDLDEKYDDKQKVEDQIKDSNRLYKNVNLSKIFENINFESLKNGKKWGKIFQTFNDSKDYLIKSKKSIPQKRRNLLFQYQLGIKNKNPNSFGAIYGCQQQQNSSNNSQQYQGEVNSQIKNNKSSQRKEATEQSLSVGIRQNQSSLQQELRSESQRNQLKNQIKVQVNILPKNSFIENEEVNQIYSSSARIQSNQTSSNNILKRKDTIISSYLGNNYSNQTSLHNTNINLTDNQIQFMTYRDRIKHNSYQSTQIVQDLIEKQKIQEDPEIAEQKIKLSKYFMDETISLQEKRSNFKDIQMFFNPENKKFNEKMCREILPFLNQMKNYFLKIELNPLNNCSTKQGFNDKSRLKRGKTGFTSLLSNSEYDSVNSITKFNNTQGGSEESKNQLQRSSTIKLAETIHPLTMKPSLTSTRNFAKKEQTLMHLIDE